MAAFDTDSWDWEGRTVVVQASADSLVADVDSDVDSCRVDRALVLEIVDKRELLGQLSACMEGQVELGSFRALVLPQAVDSWAAKLAVSEFLRLLSSAASLLADSET